MNTNLTIDVPGKTRGIPLWSALLALLLLAAAVAAAIGYLIYSTRSDRVHLVRELQALQTRQERAELEQKKGIEDARLTTALAAQGQVRAQAGTAIKVLEQLLAEADKLAADAAALKGSEAGRQIALHPDLVAQARRLYDSDLPLLAPRQTIVSKLENARRIDQQVASASGTAYEPEAQLAGSLPPSALWAEQELSHVRQVQAVLSALMREAKVKDTDRSVTADSPTLDTAISQLTQVESAFRQRLITEKTDEAKPQAIEIVVQAAVNKSLEEARLQATNIMAGVMELMKEQQRQELLRQAEAQQALAETRLQITNLMTQLQDRQAEQHRQVIVQQAESKLADQKAEAKVEETKLDTRKIAMRQRAEDPALRALLAPFITPGYHQLKGSSYDKQPLSYTGLISCSALEPTMRGLTKLVSIANWRGDRERPRWELRGGVLGWGQHQESIERAKEAQQALIELGPVLVELGMLSP